MVGAGSDRQTYRKDGRRSAVHKLHLLEVLAEFTVSIWHKEVDGLDEQVLAVEGPPPQVPQLAGQAGRAGAALPGQVRGSS